MAKPHVRTLLCSALVFSPAIASADVVLDWNEIMITVVRDQPRRL